MTLPNCIDFQELRRQRRSSIDALATSCANTGFVGLTNHDIDPNLLRAVFDQMRSFFHSSAEDKRRVSRTFDNPWGFYDQELTKNRADWKEIYDFGIDFMDGPVRTVALWPTALPEFKRVMQTYFRECERLCHDLLGHICMSLDVDTNSLSRFFQPVHSSFLRLNYYPLCPEPAPRHSPADGYEGHLGINRHTDAGGLTLLATDGLPGLQVYIDGWQDIAVEPSTFLINIGDMLEVWSNRRYRAPEHRVLANSRHERFSAPFFFNPSFDTVCSPLPGTYDQENPRQFRPVSWSEFRLSRAAGDYQDQGHEIQISDYLMHREARHGHP